MSRLDTAAALRAVADEAYASLTPEQTAERLLVAAAGVPEFDDDLAARLYHVSEDAWAGLALSEDAAEVALEVADELEARDGGRAL